MAFALGFLSGVVFIVATALIYNYRGKERRRQELEYQFQRDSLLLKALPVYDQAVRIFQKPVIEPQKIASLMFIAKLVEENLEEEIEKTPPNSKPQ